MYKKEMAKKIKQTTAEVRKINTSLIGKEEVFRMLSLAEATSLPLLLEGPPGVAKTKAVIDYAKAYLLKSGKATEDDFMSKIFILETDEGTKQSEIKGMPDFDKLFTQNKYELFAPIANAEVVIINEVDKASSAIRNAMLGVMAEKFLFSGKHKIKCNWKLFVGTCNEIPKDEVDSPFWDRFMLKMGVSRVGAGEMAKYYKQGDKAYIQDININVPSVAEMGSVAVSTNKVEKFLDVGYTSLSDRTLTFVPKLTKAVSYIWDCSVDKALIKVADIMIGNGAGTKLGEKLTSTEMKVIFNKIEFLKSHNEKRQLDLAVAEIEMMVQGYASKNLLDQEQIDELQTTLQYMLNAHPANNQGDIDEEILEELMDVDVADASPF
jgi:DNA polymerase III delta prime subunit